MESIERWKHDHTFGQDKPNPAKDGRLSLSPSPPQ